MPAPGRASQTKRARERSNQERKQGKREERAKRKEDKKNKPNEPGFEDQDPDLIGIVAGPQPIQDDF